MRKYICFYQRKQLEVEAESSYAAQKEAARIWKLGDKKRIDITVVLADVPINTASI
jgi:hypothetical protein